MGEQRRRRRQKVVRGRGGQQRQTDVVAGDLGISSAIFPASAARPLSVSAIRPPLRWRPKNDGAMPKRFEPPFSSRTCGSFRINPDGSKTYIEPGSDW